MLCSCCHCAVCCQYAVCCMLMSCLLHITTTPSGLTLTLQFYYLHHLYTYPCCMASCLGLLDPEDEGISVLGNIMSCLHSALCNYKDDMNLQQY